MSPLPGSERGLLVPPQDTHSPEQAASSLQTFELKKGGWNYRINCTVTKAKGPEKNNSAKVSVRAPPHHIPDALETWEKPEVVLLVPGPLAVLRIQGIQAAGLCWAPFCQEHLPPRSKVSKTFCKIRMLSSWRH